jgi:ATP/maltotriose-dependent transcriptional regulator MalT/DNA-binding SARP family transcriptional activator
LTTVVAGAGFGKSTLLAVWATQNGSAWYTVTSADRDLATMAAGLTSALALRAPALSPAMAGVVEWTLGPDAAGDERSRARACAGLIADALASSMRRDLAIVIDDLHEIGPTDPGASLIEALCRQAPARLHLVLASRDPLPFSVERLRGQGHLAALTGQQLGFDRDETAAVVHAADELAGDDTLVDEIQGATGGWPAAVRLAVEALRGIPAVGRRSMLERVMRPSGAIYAYLAEEVLGREPVAIRELLRAVAPLPRFNAVLCAAMGIAGAEETIGSLEDRGLFVQPFGEGDWYGLHPLIRDYLLLREPPAPEDAPRTATAAAWFEANGSFRDAFACWESIGDAEALADSLRRHGAEMIAAGDVETVLAAATIRPAALRGPIIDRLEGEARQVRGDWEGALACFARVTSEDGPIEPGVAWRMGLIHHLRGDLDAALAVYRRGRADGADLRDDALLRAWTASAHWLRGDGDACRELAAAALETASASGDDQALAAAHTIAAMVAALDGDRRANDAHYLRALDHAARAGDVLQTIRIRANRGSRFVEEGYYEEAIAELDEAVASAEVAGFAAFHALALSNRGEALSRVGRLDEAIGDLEAARGLYQRLESRLVAYPLGHLGDVYSERGAFALARSCFEEALAVADASHDVQGLRPSLSGLAEILAGEEPERAAALAERSVAMGPGIGLARALRARARVALACGALDEARTATGEAEAEARARRDRAGIAEALTLQAQVESDRDRARRLFEEALVLWHELNCAVPAARIERTLAGFDDGSAGRDRVDAADAVLRSVGAHRSVSPRIASALGEDRRTKPRSASVRTLGGFELVRDGGTVPLAEWGSRKARDTLKILIARRGRVPRDQLIDLLWPDDDPVPAGRRLSVAISTIRAVLDPGHRLDAGHYLAGNRDAVWLVDGGLAIDVETFLADAADGLTLAAAGRLEEAGSRLRSAEAAYRGDFLVEDAYEDWAVGLREEARQTYVGVGHELARIAAAQSDHVAAAGYLRRVLQQDEFDERAHLGLVGALAADGRPADARRAYNAYVARMEELGVEAAPFPG